MPAFDIGRFVESCFAALDTDRPVDTIRDLLNLTVSKPSSLIEGLPDPLGQELVLFRDPRLTIIQVTIAPGRQYPPHNHRMEASGSTQGSNGTSGTEALAAPLPISSAPFVLSLAQ